MYGEKTDYWKIKINGGGYHVKFTCDYYVGSKNHYPIQLNLFDPLPIANHHFVNFNPGPLPYSIFYPSPIYHGECKPRLF
jgi:hypothetical protein